MSTTKIKICGVTRPADAAGIATAGADFIGVNFWAKSKRRVTPTEAAAIVEATRAARPIPVVGVFVDLPVDEVIGIAQLARLDMLQLHGDESPADARELAMATGLPVWKAIPAAPDLALGMWDVDAILLDTPSPDRGGTGVAFDWSLAAAVRVRLDGKLVLAGGLAPGNVAAAIAAVHPWAVDVASGVESAPGIKDPAKVASFIAAIRSA